MPEYLLSTKFYIPPPRPDAVPRPRLRERLNEGLRLGHKLMLVSAPAGFGKTTLLSEWMEDFRFTIYDFRFMNSTPRFTNAEAPFKDGVPASTDDVPSSADDLRADAGEEPKIVNQEIVNLKSKIANRTAWLSLDGDDNDPVRFWMYVIAALQHVEADLGQGVLDALQSPQRPPIEALLTLLINQIAALDEGLVLVLDDYHLITTRGIHDALTFLLDHLPSKAHLVIATRADPPLPLARLRGRGQLTELRQADLHFTAEEAATFLERVSGLALSAEDIVALEARTEGWITGLQLAALSMRGREDISDFVSGFAGGHRYILDYLTEEVLQRQPEGIRDFLLRTSILDRLSGPLCDVLLRVGDLGSRQAGETPALHAFDDSQAVLEYLESNNLFVVPLDDQRIWYRYHRLFSDLLRARLEDLYPDHVPTLHRCASAWYEREAMLDDAIKHAIAGEDLSHVAHIIEAHGRSLLMRGELSTLLRWVATLPQAMIEDSARICTIHAWALLLTGQTEGIESRLQQAEHLLEMAPEDPLWGDIAVIRAYGAAQQGDVARTIALANQALDRLPSTRQGERSVAFFVLGSVHFLSGNWAAAGEMLDKAATTGREGGNLHLAVPALNSLASIQAIQGNLHQAQATAEAAMGLAPGAGGRPLPIAAGAISALAELAYEWNALDEALVYAHQSVDLSRLWGNSDTLGFSYLTLADVLVAHGRLEEAREALQEAEQLCQAVMLSPSFFPHLHATRARLWLAQGGLKVAASWAERVTVDYADTFHAETSLGLALVRLALGQPSIVLQTLAPLLEAARAQALNAWLIEGLALRALAHHAQDDEARALLALTEALVLAEPEGYVRTFVDLGPALAVLLRKAASQGIAVDYINTLLSAFDIAGEGPVPQVQPLVEPLSPRELEVLSLVAAGYSNREVGQQLHIAESTVKSHLNNVYGKLGVENRTQAAAKARALHLLKDVQDL